MKSFIIGPALALCLGSAAFAQTACTTPTQVYQNVAQAAPGARITDYKGVAAQAFVARVSDEMGTESPTGIDEVIAVRVDDKGTILIAFAHGCAVGKAALPSPVVDKATTSI